MTKVVIENQEICSVEKGNIGNGNGGTVFAFSVLNKDGTTTKAIAKGDIALLIWEYIKDGQTINTSLLSNGIGVKTVSTISCVAYFREFRSRTLELVIDNIEKFELSTKVVIEKVNDSTAS